MDFSHLGLVETVNILRKHLSESILPFWFEHSWDEARGGFLTRVDRNGRLLEKEPKYLMMQARMIASLAWAAGFGVRHDEYLQRAREGFEFLLRNFRDSSEDGLFFSLNRDGSPHSRRKNSDVHAYVITALSVYYDLSRDSRALDLALELFEALQTSAVRTGGGYSEDFDGGEWPPLNSEQMSLSGGGEVTTTDLHTNLLEASLYLYGSSGSSVVRQAGRDLFQSLVGRCIDPKSGATFTAFDQEWRPLPDSSGTFTTSFGLNVELSWLFREAADRFELSEPRIERAADRLLDHALAHGFDWSRGGLAASGPMNKPEPGPTAGPQHLGAPEPRVPPEGGHHHFRPWWTQAELLNALTSAYRRSEGAVAESRLETLRRELNWIWRYQIDHEWGDWYSEVDPSSLRPVTTDKGGEFKTAFHVSRALIRTIEALSLSVGDSNG